MSKFDGDIRTSKVLDDTELRASLKGGWHKELPAIKDENGVMLVGRRRLEIARQEGIEPVIKVVTFGSGPEAEAERTRLANVSNIGGAPMTREDRQRQAERLYKSGLTMEAIAHMLGVSQPTITNDLRRLLIVNKREPKVDTLGRKNTGRSKSPPKEPRPKITDPHKSTIVALADAGLPASKIGAQVGINKRVVGRLLQDEKIKREAEAQIDPATLSLTAQQKLDAAIRQHKAQLDAAFHTRVLDEVRKRVDEIVLPHWKKQIEQAHKLYERRRGAMEKETFNMIRRALHPDSRHSISDKKLAEAFDAFMGLEKFLLDEKSSPTVWGDLPSSLAEWDAMRVKRPSRRSGNGTVARR